MSDAGSMAARRRVVRSGAGRPPPDRSRWCAPRPSPATSRTKCWRCSNRTKTATASSSRRRCSTWRRDRRLSHRAHHRPRRHGRGVSRARHAAASRRRVKGAAAAPVPRRSDAGAPAPGSARGRGAVASGDRHGVCARRDRRSDLHRVRISRRPHAARRARRRPARASRARSRSRGRLPPRCRPRTIAASCIATSSPRTSSSPATAA